MPAYRQRRGLSSVALLLSISGLSFSAAVHPAWAEDQQLKAPGWKIRFEGSESRPVIAEGVLYVGSADGAVYALDPRNGQTKWRFQTGGGLSPGTSGLQNAALPRDATLADAIKATLAAAEKPEMGKRRIDETPVTDRGTVFVGSGDLSFYAIDAVTGAQKWSFEAKETIYRTTVRNGVAYFVTASGLYALDATTGQKQWLYETLQEMSKEQMNFKKSRPPQGPVIGDSVIFLTAWPFVGSNTPKKSYLYAIVPALGKPKWVVTFDGLHISAPSAANGMVLVSVEPTQPPDSHSTRVVTLHGIDAAGGQERWHFDAPLDFSSEPILISGNTICFATDKCLFALDLATGKPLWSFLKDEVTSVSADDRWVYVVSHKGSFARPNDTLHSLSLSEGTERWSRSLSGSARVAGVEGGSVFTIGVPVLQAIDAGTGKVRWTFKEAGPESRPLISGNSVFLPTASRDNPSAPDDKPTLFHFGGRKRVEHHDGHLYGINAESGRAEP